MPEKTNIEVRFDKSCGVTTTWVRHVIFKTLKAEKTSMNVNVLITGDRQIRKLNKRFLKHDYATDVISFHLNENLGEVVVSADFARRYSKRHGIPYKEELARYLVHGTLHLLGYDDKKKKDFKKMYKRQEQILNQCGRSPKGRH